jgi:hypothetical protein
MISEKKNQLPCQQVLISTLKFTLVMHQLDALATIKSKEELIARSLITAITCTSERFHFMFKFAGSEEVSKLMANTF